MIDSVSSALTTEQIKTQLDSIKNDKSDQKTKKFSDLAKKVISNLGSNEDQIISIISYGASAEATPQESTILQHLMSKRQQTITIVSNIISSMHEVAMSVVRNFKL